MAKAKTSGMTQPIHTALLWGLLSTPDIVLCLLKIAREDVD